MHISKFAVKRPVTILMIIFIVILLGVVSVSRVGIDLFPEMNLPVAIVITSYEGAGPEEIEKLVTKPIEESIASVSNIERITSSTTEGVSLVSAEFSWGTDMDYAALKMREQIGLIKGMLPDDVSEPLVAQFDPSMMPISIWIISGPQGEEELKNMTEDIIKPRLERLEGVASATVVGGRERQIRVKLDLTRLQGYGLSPRDVSGALAAQNLNSPGGTVDEAGFEYLVRTVGEFRSVEEIRNVLIPTPGGSSVRLGDIASVVDGYDDYSQYNYMNGKPCVGIIVQKQSGTNTVRVSERVETEIERLQKGLPEGTEITAVMDQADYITSSINNVARNAIIGAVLAVLVIYIFLRNISSTLIIGTAIPISVIATFILVYFNGLTLNLMSMGGLALGVGMLVDNSIVVLENIYRHRQLGKKRPDAAVAGSTQVANAITASTLTTLAVFLPIVFVEGLASQLFREMAMTVSFALLSSLAVSLTLIPMLSSKFMRVENGPKGEKEIRSVRRKLLKKASGWQNWLNSKYTSILSWALKHRIKTLLVAFIFFVLSLAALPLVGAEFIPKMDTGQFQIAYNLPKGTALEKTKEMGSRLEEIISSYEEVEYIYFTAGATSQDMQLGTSGQSHTGQIYVTLRPLKERKKSTEQIVEEIRQKLAEIPDLESDVTVGDGFSMGTGGSPIRIEIKGDDFAVLRELGDKISAVVEEVRGTREVSFSMEEGRPELRLVIMRDKAASFGLTPSQIAGSVRTAISGSVATLYRTGGEEISIIVEAMEKDKEGLEDLRSLLITTPMGNTIPLSQVAEFQIQEGPIEITRDNQVRTAYVTADITSRDLRSIVEDIRTGMKDIAIPGGYAVEFGGEQQEMAEAFGDLTLALVLAIALVYMIMAAQFESLVHPFIIMFAIPLALVGAVFGLFVTGRTFSVPAFIGLIMLSGIVVNNAIVMVDYINYLRKEGRERTEAILEAGPVRLRPILMTALTTALAMLPIATGIGEGAEAQAPLATVVIGGLLTSTFLTLVVIPVIYTFVDGFGAWFKRKFWNRLVSDSYNTEGSGRDV